MEHECPEQFEVCFTQDDWINFVTDYELEIIDEIGSIYSATNECTSVLWTNNIWNI